MATVTHDSLLAEWTAMCGTDATTLNDQLYPSLNLIGAFFTNHRNFRISNPEVDRSDLKALSISKLLYLRQLCEDTAQMIDKCLVEVRV